MLVSACSCLLSFDVFAQEPMFAWAKRMGGSASDLGYSIAVDATGNVYTTGFFAGTVDFDPGPGVFNLGTAGSSNIFVSKLDAAGNFLWAKQMVGESWGSGNSLALDLAGNVYITGEFEGTTDFDPGPDVFNMSALGERDIFVTKLDSSGNFLWAKRIGGEAWEQGNSLALDAAGNIFLTGYFTGTADFDPGPDVFNLSSAGGSDVFVAKLDFAGNFLWAKRMGGPLWDSGNSLALDPAGNVCITGDFAETVDFDPGMAVFNLTSAGNRDIFVSKLDAAGNFLWARRMGGTAWDEGNSLAIAATGDIYLTGGFNGIADFDPGPSLFHLTSTGAMDIFVTKLDTAGNLIWAKQMGGAGTDNGSALTVDAVGNIYITGSFVGTADFDPGPGVFNLSTPGGYREIFVIKLDALGNFLWANRMGGTFDDFGHSLTVDAAGNIHITGRFRNTGDFDPGPGVFNLSSAGYDDIFVLKLSQPAALAVSLANTTPATCAGNSDGSASIIASGGVPPLSCLWSNAATGFNVDGLAPGTYSVTVTDAGGQTQSVSVTVAVESPSPTAGFTSIVNGGSGSFANTSTAAATYFWDFGDGNTDTQENPGHSYTQSGTYTVTLTVSNLCGNDSATQTIEVVLCQPPVTAFTVDKNEVCPGEPVTFTSLSDHAEQLLWTFHGGEPLNATQSSVSVSYAQAGLYAVVLNAFNDCGNNQIIQEDFIRVLPSPSPAFTYDNQGLTVHFNNASEASLFYHWDFGDNQNSTESNPSHAYSSPGTYLVTLSATNACGTLGISQWVTVSTVQAYAPMEENMWRAYPNPGTGRFVIEVESSAGGEMLITMFNAAGLEIHRERLMLPDGFWAKGIDLSEQPAGIYWLRMESSDRVWKKKLEVQR